MSSRMEASTTFFIAGFRRALYLGAGFDRDSLGKRWSACLVPGERSVPPQGNAGLRLSKQG